MRATPWFCLVIIAGCSGGNLGGDGTGTGPGGPRDPGVVPECGDADGDGFGPGCSRGADCDDGDPTRNLGCETTVFGEGGRAFDSGDPDQDLDDVVVDPRGWITLGSDVDGDTFVWTANSGEGTVSKLDSRTGREVARYPSAITYPANGARPWNEHCNQRDSGNCPSRTALDFRRDAWIANRGFANQGTVTKIASHAEDCVDRNGNGAIETSTDANGDGRIDLGSPAEFFGDADECVLFTVDVGAPGDIPRALAIAPDWSRESIHGNAWIGLNGARRAVELRGTDGAVVRELPLDINPYGALAAKDLHVVWFTNAGWQADADNPPAVQNIDFTTGEVSRRYEVDQAIPGCSAEVGTYGITVDERGRVWVAGYPCEGAFRLDPVTATWTAVPTPGHGRPRGLVASGDGWIYMAHSHCGGDDNCATLSRFRIEAPWDVDRVDMLPLGAAGSIGVDMDVDGRVWVVNKTSSTAARYDPATGAVDQFPVGEGPYTYSDFTGHGLYLQFPRGYYRAVTEGCPGAIWTTVGWEGSIPEGSSVEVSVRTAETRDALRAAAWTGTWNMSPARLSEAPGPITPGKFIEVELALSSDEADAVPAIGRLSMTYECPVM